MEDTILEQEERKHTDEYAGFWIRFVAYLIDSIIISIPLGIISIIIFIVFFGATGFFDAMATDPEYIEQELTNSQIFAIFGAYLLVAFINFIGVTIYFAGFHSSKWQATIGKKLVGLKVTDMDGKRITFWRAVGRLAAKSFLSSIFMIGYIIAAFTEKKQSLHDLVVSTVVVKK